MPKLTSISVETNGHYVYVPARFWNMGYARGFSASIVCPDPPVEEERECSDVAYQIRSLIPWPNHPE